MEFGEILKLVSTCISIILGAVTLGGMLKNFLLKPMQNKMDDFKDEFKTEINSSINKSNQLLKNEINDVKKEIGGVKTELSNVKEDLSDKIFKNEKDRLKSELFDCGNRCRRKMPLYLEEFRHIQAVYEKYHDELHANGNGKEEYDFISTYFNSQFNQDLIKWLN